MEIDKVIALCFLIGGLISNGIGFAIDAITFSSDSWVSWINIIFTGFGCVLLLILFFFLSKKKLYSFYNFIALTFFACIDFPIILFSSPDGVFISYLSLLVPAIGLMHYKYKKYYIIGIISLIMYWIVYSIKVHLGINMSSEYMKHNYIHFMGGITGTFIFSLIVSSVTTLKLIKFLEKDTLTGISNRHAFEEAIHNKNITFGIMIDIDHFKKVNDTYGHKVGDIILKSLCDIVSVYTNDDLKMYRYGGEEFILLSTQKEMDLMTSLKAMWIALNWQFTFKEDSFSISMGIAKNNNDAKNMILEADQQLYKAKEAGRHQAWYNDKVILYN